MFIVCMFTFSCRRCSSVVEHVIGNDGVASPILASGTIKKASHCGGFFNGYVAETDLRGHKQVRRQSQAKFGEGERAKREPLVCAVALAARTSLPAAPFLIMHLLRCFFCMCFKALNKFDFEDF